jgi:hypothetical protein
LDTEREWAHERERLLDGFIENIMQNPHYRIYKAGDNFIIYERYIQLSWTLEEYIRYIFEEVGGRNPLCGYLSANKVCERYFSKQTPIVEGGIDDKNNGLSEAKAFQLMYAEVGGGSVNINLLANLTRKQLNTAHLDYRTEEGHVIDVWLNKGEYANLAGGFEDEKVAAKILYYIKPKSSPKDRKDLKVDDLTVFEFRPDLS